MPFSIDQIAVPFRMQPGMRRMAEGEAHLHRLAPHSALWQEKQAALDAGAGLLQAPGFDARAALQAIHERALRDGALTPAHTAPQGAAELALMLEQDLAVIDADGRLAWACICTPSHWAPEARIGQHLSELHAPVADGALLLAATLGLQKLIVAGDCWERHVWSISPSARHDQHPTRHQREPWPLHLDAAALARHCQLRVERQTFFPVPGAAQAVFTIRVMLQPLTEAVRTADQAAHLRAALASMSDAVLDYKNLTAAQPQLLQWLHEISHD